MSYLGRSAKLSRKTQEKVSFLATAGQTSKTGLSYVPTFVEVSVNGILLTDVTDYTATTGSSVSFGVALELNDEVTVVALKTFALADHYTKTQTDSAVSAAAAALVDSSPAALNTLNELAAALGDDANYATTTTNAIATKMPKSGGAFTGAVTTNSTIDGRDVAADGVLATNAMPKGGGAFTGAVTTNSTFDGVDIATRDGILTSTTATAAAALPKAGGTMTGDTLHGDNVKAKFGAGNDLEIYHDGNKSNISDVGTGNLILTASNLTVKDAGGTNRYLTTDASTTATRIYHNNVGRLATTATGVAVTGSTVHTAGDVKNTISGTYKLFGANGTAGSNSYVTYAFEGDNDTGMNRTGNNNLQLVTAGAAAIKIDGAGVVTKPLQPAFHGFLSSSVGSNSGWTKVPLNAEKFDIGNNFNTSNGTFTVPVSGRYILTGHFHSATASSYLYLAIYAGSTPLPYLDSRHGYASGTDTMLGGSVIANLTANDAITLHTYSNSANYVMGGGDQRTSLAGYFLG